MKILLVGVGGVGEAIAAISKPRPWLELWCWPITTRIAAWKFRQKLGDKNKFPVEWVDANKKELIIDLARKYKVDLIMNACDPSFNVPIFDAAYEYGCNYMDMAMTLSEPHPEKPFEQCGDQAWGITNLSVPKSGRKKVSSP